MKQDIIVQQLVAKYGEDQFLHVCQKHRDMIAFRLIDATGPTKDCFQRSGALWANIVKKRGYDLTPEEVLTVHEAFTSGEFSDLDPISVDR